MIATLFVVIEGLVASVSITRVKQGMQFVISSTDPLTFLAIPALLSAVAVLTALRHE